ncbi:hypothetical protein [Niallia sp. 01092]|uniref:hypothetical protein n=1 Tax=unclassified Niallia TaxID=2837522 RepID=UPI003FD211EA
MKILKAKIPVFINGVIIEPESIFSCPEEQADKFIKSKSAVLHTEKKTKTTNSKEPSA